MAFALGFPFGLEVVLHWQVLEPGGDVHEAELVLARKVSDDQVLGVERLALLVGPLLGVLEQFVEVAGGFGVSESCLVVEVGVPAELLEVVGGVTYLGSRLALHVVHLFKRVLFVANNGGVLCNDLRNFFFFRVSLNLFESFDLVKPAVVF